jgi:2-polyprenyl-6-hydroxyphenyl methylase / 3-demethylubiquinone-9 3-methyltransferase
MMWKTAVPANDLTQYDTLADQWWDPRGPFAILSWIAERRGQMISATSRPDAMLVDVACGGGLLHPYIEGKGYRHIGVDQSEYSLEVAQRHGVDEVIQTDVTKLPFDDSSVDVVVAGQCLEHMEKPYTVAAECCRILRPGGLLVLDTIATTLLARFVIITLGEHLPLPGMPAKGCHDHRMFIDRDRLASVARENGVPLKMYGLLPRTRQIIPWLFDRRPAVQMYPSTFTGVLFQAVGTKIGGAREG